MALVLAALPPTSILRWRAGRSHSLMPEDEDMLDSATAVASWKTSSPVPPSSNALAYALSPPFVSGTALDTTKQTPITVGAALASAAAATGREAAIAAAATQRTAHLADASREAVG